MSPAHTMQQTIEKNNAPWLSVLIPVFNVQAYLEECVDSVMSQADRGVEVILLDDRSTDNSFAVMEMLAKRWPGQLTLLQHIVNSGPGAARNTMIDVAHGEYIWFLDSDDKLMPDCISELRSTIEMHAPDVVLCDFGVYRDQQTLKHKLRREHHKHTFCGRRCQLMHDRAYVLTGLLHTGQLHPWSKISRRALWNSQIRFPEGVYFEDMLPTLLMISRAQSFFYQPRPWVAYRQWNNSILASMTLKKACDQSMALLPLRNALKNESWADNPKLHFAWAHQCARNLTGAMRFLARQAAHTVSFQEARMLASRFRADFEAASPLSARELQTEYLFSGRLGSYLKFHRWFGYKRSES